MMTGPGKGNVSQATEFDCLGADAVAWHGNSDPGRREPYHSHRVVFVLYILYFLYSLSLFVDHVHAKLAV